MSYWVRTWFFCQPEAGDGFFSECFPLMKKCPPASFCKDVSLGKIRMKRVKAEREFKAGILLVILFFALSLFSPCVSVAADSASEGEPGGGATQELTTLEILGLGALGVLGIVVLVDALEDDDLDFVPTHGAHGTHGGH